MNTATIAAAPLDPAIAASGWRGLIADWSSDRQAFHVSWGKPMMWIFLLSDTFIFGCFLISYMTVRVSTTVPWPNPSEVFSLTMFGSNVPLLLIAIMTFVLISSSGTMAMAVNFGYRRDRKTPPRCCWRPRPGRHLRRHAGLRVVQADPRRRAALGQPDGARRSSARPSS
jgi:hypothetical protein